jgi:hypothetical protein
LCFGFLSIDQKRNGVNARRDSVVRAALLTPDVAVVTDAIAGQEKLPSLPMAEP